MEHKKRFAGLDGLRAIFCIGIVIYHVNEPLRWGGIKWLDPVYKYGGYFGNSMFFMLSGLLTAYHYKNKIIQQESSFRAFMEKRIRKIYPLYFLTNLFAVLLLILSGTKPAAKKLIVTFLMVANGWFDGREMPYNFPTWFLCVLILLYIMYYAAAKASSRFPRLYFPMCAFLLLWGMLLVTKDWDLPFNYRTCGEGYMNFFLGVLLAEVIMSSPVKKEILAAANLLIFSAIMISVYLFGLETIPVNLNWIVSCLCANMIFIAVYGRFPVKALTFPPLQAIGKCSFSIYLWHIPVVRTYLMIEKKFLPFYMDSRWNFILYFLVLIAVSALSYRYFERKSGFRKK